MKLIETRFLRGPNLHARRRCLQAIVDLEGRVDTPSSAIPGFVERLLQWLPGLHEHHCSVGRPGGFVQRLHEGTYLAHVTEHVLLELQSRAGTEVGFGRARAVRGTPGHYRIVAAYQCEVMARQAVIDAVALVNAAAAGEDFDIEAALQNLRRLHQRHGIGPSTQAVLDAARARHIPILRLAPDSSLFQLGWGSRQRRLQATITGRSSYLAVTIASDKAQTKELLAAGGIPVPTGQVVQTLEAAREAARRIGWPVVVKPLDANQGKGVCTSIEDDAQLAAAFERAQAWSRDVIVERHVVGEDHRVLVVEGRAVAASRRRPPSVTGDGVHTVAQLIEQINADPRRGMGHEKALTRIVLDDEALQRLAAHGATPDTVLPAGQSITLRGNANLSTGGTAEDMTDRMHPEVALACVRAVRRVGLDVAGVDVVCRDIGLPLQAQGGAIVEVNAAPGLRMHEQPSSGEPRAVGQAIVDAMFPPGEDGRIPLIAVTGTNGKTTTTLAIAHTFQAAGWRTGHATTEGIFIDGREVVHGDCTGFWSARSVLSDPDVDVAVLETARGGILKRGLGFDRCDVAVVLNVSDDHVGQDGIETVEDLARVKAVVADAAVGTVVLNAQDEHCVRMAGELTRKPEVLYFSLDPRHPVVVSHVNAGGRAVVLRDGMIMLVTRGTVLPIVRADALPFTLGGRLRFNVANALAAVGALVAATMPPAQIANGLSSFNSSSAANPLRFNLFRVRGVWVVVDYAHNPAAYRALIEDVRKLGVGRVIGVVSAPGDRADEELAEIGRICSQGFDETILYEMDEYRGRPRGATASAMQRGAGEHAVTVLDVRDALRAGLRRCRSGDCLVMGCASDIADLMTAAGEDGCVEVSPDALPVVEALTPMRQEEAVVTP